MPDPTWYLSVDNDDTALDGTPNAPGDRWCVLWGPQGPCDPYVEGPYYQWLAIAEAIEQGIARRFKRVAFAPALDQGGSLHSPRNSTGERDHVHLTRAELDGLVRSIRDQLAPTPYRAGAIPDDLAALLTEHEAAYRDSITRGRIVISDWDVAGARWRAAEDALAAWTRAHPSPPAPVEATPHAEMDRLRSRIDALKAERDSVSASLGVESSTPAILRTIERVRGDIKRKDREWAAMRDERDRAVEAATAPVAVGLLSREELRALWERESLGAWTLRPGSGLSMNIMRAVERRVLARHRAPVEATREATGGAAKRYVVVTKDEAKPWDGHGGAWFDDDRNARSAADRMNRGIDRRDAVRWDLFYDRMPHHVAAIVDLWSSNGECTFTSRRPVRECLDCAAKEDGDE